MLPLSNQIFSLFFIPALLTSVIIIPFRIGYTTRRCGERGRFQVRGKDVSPRIGARETGCPLGATPKAQVLGMVFHTSGCNLFEETSVQRNPTSRDKLPKWGAVSVTLSKFIKALAAPPPNLCEAADENDAKPGGDGLPGIRAIPERALQAIPFAPETLGAQSEREVHFDPQGSAPHSVILALEARICWPIIKCGSAKQAPVRHLDRSSGQARG